MNLDWTELLYTEPKRKALRILFRNVDAIFTAGEFELCDEFLKIVDLERLSLTLLVGLLSITFAAREKLNHREDLVKRVGARLQKLLPEDPQKVEQLMRFKQ